MSKPVMALIVVVGLLSAALVYSKIRHQPATVSGYFEADEIRVGSRVGGRVLKVHVSEGDPVKAGQVLVELEPFDLHEKRAEAEQKLAQAQANLNRLNAGFRKEEIEQARAKRDQLEALYKKTKAGPRKKEIDIAAKEVKLAESERELAFNQYTRTQKLFDKKIATKEEYDEVVSRKLVTEARLAVKKNSHELMVEGSRQEDIDYAKAKLSEAEYSLALTEHGYRKEDIAAAAAQVKAAKESLNAIDRQIKELTITAPGDGIVETIELQPGDLVNANAPAISLIDMKKLWIRTYVPQKYANLQINDSLDVTIDGYPDKKFKGKVIFIARQAEFSPANVQTPEERSKQVFRIKVEIDNINDLKLRPGMTTDIWLDGPVEKVSREK